MLWAITKPPKRTRLSFIQLIPVKKKCPGNGFLRKRSIAFSPALLPENTKPHWSKNLTRVCRRNRTGKAWPGFAIYDLRTRAGILENARSDISCRDNSLGLRELLAATRGFTHWAGARRAAAFISN